MTDILEIYKRRIELQESNPEYSQFVREFAYDRCHYLTMALSKKLKTTNIAIFYLSKTNQIIHSAVLTNNYAIDAFGKQSIADIETFYNYQNKAMGKFDEYGQCEHFQTTLANLIPNRFYDAAYYDLDTLKKIIDKWFDNSGNLKL